MTKEEIENWDTFRKDGLLWFVNRTIHLFGWQIVYDDSNGPLRVFVERTTNRGFSRESEERGFARLTNYLSLNIELLENDLES